MDFLEVVEKRHSVRKFADKPVEKELIDTIIRIAETAPSSKNTRSSAFMIIEDRDTIAAISEMRDSGSSFVKDAPAVIVVMGDESKTDLWVDNCAISTTFIQLAATAMAVRAAGPICPPAMLKTISGSFLVSRTASESCVSWHWAILPKTDVK